MEETGPQQCRLVTQSGERCVVTAGIDSGGLCHIHCGEMERLFGGALARKLQGEIGHWKNEAKRERDRRSADGVLAGIPRGKVHDFDPRGCFVYVLLDEDRRTPLYIGQSTNLLPRLGQHMHAHYGKQVTLVVTIRCSHELEMRGMERMLIRQYHPRLNIALRQAEAI